MRTNLIRSESARAALGIAALLAIVLLWRAGLLGDAGGRVVDDARNAGRNAVDVDLQVQNYYDQVLDFDRGLFDTTGLVRDVLRQARQPGDDARRLDETEVMRDLDDAGFLRFELVPGAEVVHKGAHVRVNRWGMRDRDREKAKPARTMRIAFVGASNAMASGVEMEQGFVYLLEERLNRELAGGAYDAYEVVNFSVNGHHLLSRLYVIDQRVAEWEPDLVLCTAYLRETRVYITDELTKRVIEQRDLHFDFIRRIVADAGVSASDRESRISQRLTRRRYDLVLESFRELARISQRIGVPVAVVALRLDAGDVNRDLLWMADAAESAVPTVRIFDAYEGRSAEELYLSETDGHPSVPTHALIADELFEDLLNHPVTGPLILGGAPAPGDAQTAPQAARE